jgi:plastocyanin
MITAKWFRWAIPAGLVALLLTLAAACGGDGTPKVTQAPTSSPAAAQSPAASPAPGASPAAAGPLWAKPPIGDSWAQYFGVVEEANPDCSGPKVLDPKPGQLYFYTNSGTGWGATNKKNTVEIFDTTNMTEWKPVATLDLPDEYSVGYSSHGATVSADGRWIYLQAMANPEKPPRLLIIDGSTLKVCKVYKETLGGFGGHHVNNFTGPDGREYIMNVDFNWNRRGAGAWVMDPEKDHAIVGGMNLQDFAGNPYVFSGDIQGKFLFASVPAASAALRGKIDGVLAKVDMTTWKVVGETPVLDPIWPEITQDGKIAWVTEGDGQKVKKIDLEKMTVIAEVSTGPGPWGARLSCDESKLYTADKGESAGYAQQGRTMTIIDTNFNIVTNVVPIGRTTDHIILSPDCKYILANSNADHGIWIYDAETEQQVAVVKMPSDGDPHGGTFVQWRDDGNGGVAGEVVSTLTGLRGSARQAQQALIKAMKSAIVVKLNPASSFAGTPTNFAPDAVKVKPGATVTFLFSYASGTSGRAISVESADAGIERFELTPGQRKLVTWTAPSSGTRTVTAPSDSKAKTLTITVVDSPEAYPVTTPAASPAAQTGPRQIKIVADGLKWDIKTLDLKAGEKVRFSITNQDDEPHNLISATAGLLPPGSPDVTVGQTTSFEWQVPNSAGPHKFICNYHPSMIIDATIK